MFCGFTKVLTSLGSSTPDLGQLRRTKFKVGEISWPPKIIPPRAKGTLQGHPRARTLDTPKVIAGTLCPATGPHQRLILRQAGLNSRKMTGASVGTFRSEAYKRGRSVVVPSCDMLPHRAVQPERSGVYDVALDHPVAVGVLLGVAFWNRPLNWKRYQYLIVTA